VRPSGTISAIAGKGKLAKREGTLGSGRYLREKEWIRLVTEENQLIGNRGSSRGTSEVHGRILKESQRRVWVFSVGASVLSRGKSKG